MKRRGLIYHKVKVIAILFIVLPLSCVEDTNFDALAKACSENIEANIFFADLKNLYVDDVIQIREDLVIEGYIISSDAAGNFFGTLHVQDSPVNPGEGLQIEIDLRDSHLFYETGSKVFIKLKGLYLGQSKGVFKIGGAFNAFGNISVGRLPALKVQEHIFLACDAVTNIEPKPVSLAILEDGMVNTLVSLDSVEFIEEELGLPFAEIREETERTLKDCIDNEILLLNSGFSDFQDELLPQGNGSIIAVLLKESNDYQLVVRNLEDIDFTNERCAEIVDEFTSDAVFISELADPDNNTGARFVELYNSSSETLSLKGWTLRRYTNDNTEVSSTIDLSEFIITAESTFLISPNEAEFEVVYGFVPDLGVSTNSPADSNGDDNLELVDPFGNVIDAFGVIGEDGSGTDHEFEDGRAVRNMDIVRANPMYTFSEWTIYNDTGDSGTINMPQNAPEDFTPGVRN
ncbi:MAG: DUF5689 domain-containing protein [Saonia sp.]